MHNMYTQHMYKHAMQRRCDSDCNGLPTPFPCQMFFATTMRDPWEELVMRVTRDRDRERVMFNPWACVKRVTRGMRHRTMAGAITPIHCARKFILNKGAPARAARGLFILGKNTAACINTICTKYHRQMLTYTIPTSPYVRNVGDTHFKTWFESLIYVVTHGPCETTTISCASCGTTIARQR